MADTEMAYHLVELGIGVFGLLSTGVGYGETNIGVVIDEDGLTVIDTGPTPTLAAAARAEILDLTAELDLPIKRVVLTSSRVPFAGGSAAVWQAGFYATSPVSTQLDAPINHLAIRRLLPQFAPHYHDQFSTRPVTHTVDEAAFLTAAAYGVPVVAEGPMNLVVQLPAAGVVFAGAVASFGVTPLAFDGDPSAWADSLDALQGSTIIPGHGPPGGDADLADLAAYLRACVAADGDTAALASGPWDSWTDRRFDAVNVERAARLRRGDDSTPQAMFELLGLD